MAFSARLILPAAATVVFAVGLAACGKGGQAVASAAPPPAQTLAQTGTSAIGAPAAGDAAMQKALACAGAGVGRQQAMLAAAAKLGKNSMAGAMTASIWAKTVNDLTIAHGGTEAQAQAAVAKAIDKASAEARAGRPALDEAGLEDCIKTEQL